MSDILVKILLALGTKLLTDVFLSKVLVYGLRAAADASGRRLPEELVDAVADALAIKESGRVIEDATKKQAS